jgi:membrane-bound ClpP family serine protease
MKEFLLAFFRPGWNRLALAGIALTILGVILIPFIIGIPIAGIGFSIFAIGIIVSFVCKFPGGKRVVSEFESSIKNVFKQ